MMKTAIRHAVRLFIYAAIFVMTLPIMLLFGIIDIAIDGIPTLVLDRNLNGFRNTFEISTLPFFLLKDTFDGAFEQ